MLDVFAESGPSVPVTCLDDTALDSWLADAPAQQAGFVRAQGFKAKAGQAVSLVSADGEIERVLFGLGDGKDAFVHGALAARLQPGLYHFEPAPADHAQALLGFSLHLAFPALSLISLSPQNWSALRRLLLAS